jgi:hypothetical protein
MYSFYGFILIAVMTISACTKEDNNPPTITVGNDIIGMTGTSIPMEVSSADPDNNSLTYNWSVIESPTGGTANITVIGGATATFTTTVAGFYRVQITVDDGNGGTASGIVKLYIGGVLPSTISSNTTLPDLFSEEEYPDYYALQSVTISAGLTIAPGVVIENGSDVVILVNGSSAFLSAEGTASKNIIFRGQNKVKGSWRAINFTSTNVSNKLDHVTILHTGSTPISNFKTAVFIKSNVFGKLSIKNTNITESDGYAVYIDGNGGTFTEFANNNFSNNTLAPMRIGAEAVIKLDNTSVYAGNGTQAIEVFSSGNTNVRFDNSGTIRKVSVPYHFYSSAELRSTITFEPGVTCLFNSGLRLWVTSEGTLIADGTTADKITFSGLVQSAGAWFGIEIASPSVQNIIDFGIVTYGGSTAGRGANIYMFGSTPGSKLILTNSTVSNSQTYGIYTTSGSVTLTQSNNTFASNPSGNIQQN